MPRFFVDTPLTAPGEIALPAGAARHVQVLRLQPGDVLTLFDGSGPEWQAEVTAMGRSEVRVNLLQAEQPRRELERAVTLAVVMPANDRMDFVVEKATELGAAAIQPLQTERSVLRLDGERAAKRVAHWQAVAVGASEQSGRTRVPVIAPVRSVAAWLAALPDDDEAGRFVRSTGSAPALARVAAPAAAGRWLALSGPEGGLAPEEEAAAVARGFARISLGPLILRADTAPLAWLAQMAVLLPCAQ